jgi:putative ATPase
MSIPLAEVLRPKNLSEYLGQEHLIGEDAVLRRMIESGKIQSVIFWGPPGSGKTTLAQLIATHIKREFLQLSAINSGVKDIRTAIEKADSLISNDEEAPILFIDEIHRFNKAQQDSLLSSVEKGKITLIGATTENPSFEVISPLLSRCQVYILKGLSKESLFSLLDKALNYYQDKYPKINIKLRETEALVKLSGGDARKLFNTLEIVIEGNTNKKDIDITDELVMKCIQSNIALYDKAGEMHYDIISAFIKSIRGSDPDAAVYYLARMIDGGEDPKFICRRMIILAAEDIGLANPNAMLLANTCFEAVHKIGYPEAKIIMSEIAIYLACSQKSNSAYMAIENALRTTSLQKDLSVPLHLRNSPTKLMENLGYGKDYKYAHDYENNFIEQQFLPDKIKNARFYTPQNNESENKLKSRLLKLWKKRFE